MEGRCARRDENKSESKEESEIERMNRRKGEIKGEIEKIEVAGVNVQDGTKMRMEIVKRKDEIEVRNK